MKASFWKRLVACFIDNIIIGIAAFFIASIFGMTESIEGFFAFILFYCYGTVTEYYWQVTLGKAIMKLKVIAANGQRPTLLNSFYRNFRKIISTLPFFYGFLRILAPHRRQTIHDELGRCFVIDTGGQN